MNQAIKVALVDDHVLLRQGLAGLIRSLDYAVMIEADNGRQLVEKLQCNEPPDVILMDLNMPEMDGFQATLWLKMNFPFIKVLALSMYDDENAVVRMLKNGAKGYILKDVDAEELKRAIDTVVSKGFYYSEMVTGKLIHSIQRTGEDDRAGSKCLLNLNEKEICFLKLVTTEMTYKQMADHMNLSARTIDGYRDMLFEKLGVKSRTGLVLFAIKNGIVQLSKVLESVPGQ